nr:RIP metalloprotease RseP [Gammaproteobacteria bacterium]
MDLIAFLYSAAAFVVAIGILVTIHEFGHFWVARLNNVKVLRFSVGFGKPLWLKKSGADQTEYAICAIPLGGYVKMLDEREGEVAEEELARTFNRQPVARRFAIVAAGPMFNFLFAIIAYSLMYMNGVSGIKPYIGDLDPDGVGFAAGLQNQDLILSINGIDTPNWEKARLTLLQEAVDEPRLTLQVQGRDLMLREVDIDVSQLQLLQDDKADIIRQMGFSSWRPEIPPQIDEVIAGGAAEAAGLLAGDAIVALDGVEITNIRQWVDMIRANPQRAMRLVVERDGAQQELMLTPRRQQQDGETIGFIGVKNVVVIPEDIRQQLVVIERYGPLTAVAEAFNKTWQMSVLTLKVLGKLVVGEASLKNL